MGEATPATPATPVNVIVDRLAKCAHQFEHKDQTAYAIIGALEQHGWVIVRKRHFNDKAA